MPNNRMLWSGLTGRLQGSHLTWMGLCLMLIVVAAWQTEGYFHPDEHFQILEFANWKLGLTPSSAMPWEFNEQMRPALQPVLAWGLFAFLKEFGWFNPFFAAFLLRLVTGLLFLKVIQKMASSFLSPETKTLFLWLAIGCWFMPILGVRFSSENYAGLAFMAGSMLLLENTPEKTTRNYLLAGLAMGIAFSFRFQMAFAIIGVFAWLLLISKPKWLPVLGFIAGGLGGIGIGILADRWFYGQWVFTPWNYFRLNILEGKANAFGMEPFYWYAPEFLLKAIPPISALLLAGLVMGIRKYKKHLWTWAFIAFLAGHCLIAHKELRFLFPMLLPAMWLIANGLSSFTPKHWWRPVQKILIVINIPLLIYATCFPLNSSMGLFHFLWNRSQTHHTVFAEKETPFRFVGVDAHFYQPENIHIEVIPQLDSIPETTLLKINPGDIIVTSDGIWPLAIPGKKMKVVYQQFPDWMRRFNFNHWMERTNVWKAYEYSPNSPAY